MKKHSLLPETKLGLPDVQFMCLSQIILTDLLVGTNLARKLEWMKRNFICMLTLIFSNICLMKTKETSPSLVREGDSLLSHSRLNLYFQEQGWGLDISYQKLSFHELSSEQSLLIAFPIVWSQSSLWI